MSVNPKQLGMDLSGNIKLHRELGIEPKYQRTDTSHGAAKTVKKRVHKMALRILSELKLHGPSTADAMAERLGETPFATRPRFTELKELGLIEDTGVRAKSSSGNPMAVYRAKQI